MKRLKSIIGLRLLPLGLGFIIILVSGACNRETETPAAEAASKPAVASPVIAAWQQSETEEALRLFQEADWSQRPLFPASSPLSLSEKAYVAAVKRDRPGTGPDLMGEIQGFLRPLSRELIHAGQSAALQGDPDLARQYLEALKAFGQAIESSDLTVLVQKMGTSFVASADTELTKLGKE